MSQEATNYTQGYSAATVSSHASRTVTSDAAFLVPHIKSGDRILDVGCGPGTITIGFAALVPQGSVTGIDISEKILKQAQAMVDERTRDSQTAALQPLGNISLQKADLLAGLPFPDGFFDVVFSSQLFPHLATPDMRLKALTEMRRVVRPGGIVATRDAAELHFYPRTYDLNRLWSRNMVKALRDGTVNASFPGGEMPALYREAGFNSAQGKLQTGAGTTVYASREARRWFVGGNLGRLQQEDPYCQSWLKVGITPEEIEATRDALTRWAADDDAWYVALQAEMLGWK